MSRSFHMRPARKAQAGTFRPKDLACWQRLIRLARAAVRNPDRHAGPLGEQAGKARRAVMPPGYAHRESPFLRLNLKAHQVWQATGAARAAFAAELAPLADACADALERTGGREAIERKDIHG